MPETTNASPMPDESPGARIRMLSIHVANQIAAGEVVERPASVVKELMENAVDAGASRIDVVITAGGRRLISIADDGCGMVRDDAIMAIERQATSKIRTTEDIESISTMGFRGEALASIAAVSRFLIKTRTAHSDVGTEVEVIGGRLNDVRDCGGPVGTTIEVRDIFFNLPARRKFLRSFQTEQTHIRSAFIVQALAHPGLAMTLRCDGQETHRLPACERFEDRLRDLYGPDTLENLRAVEGGFGCVRVSGFVSLPTWTRADRNEQYIFINSRPAVAPILYHAMREAYPPIAGDRKPVIFLFIDLPPESVDVNVHPTKREVRFRNPAEVRDAVIRSISKAIGRAAHSAPDGMRQSADTATGALSAPLGSAGDWRAGDGQLGGMPNSPGLPDNASQHAAHAAMADALAQAMPASAAPRLDPQRDLPLPALHHRQDPLAPHVPLPQAPANIGAAAGTGAGDTTTSNPDQPTVNMPSGALWKWSRLLGKVGSRYVLFETDEGFVILDPPAAHARVLYEHLLQRDSSIPGFSQRLLIPQTVELPALDAQRVRRHLEIFESMGFGVSALDADAFMVDALPDILGEVACQPLLIDVAKSLEEAGPRRGRTHWREEAIARAAALAAVPPFANLTAQELTQLIRDLSACGMPYLCPRGQPTMVFNSFRDIARRFGHA